MLTFLSHHLPTDGYGIAGIETVRALERLGVEVLPVDMMLTGGRMSFPTERHWRVNAPAVVLCVPEWWPDVEVNGGGLVGWTMLESTVPPAGRVGPINATARLLVVPCEWNAEIFHEHGVWPPVAVVPFGINPAEWYPLPRPRSGWNGVYRFLWSGTPDKRKGWDLVYKAFWTAFQGRADVRLTMHFREMPRGILGSLDDQVEVVEGRIAVQGLRRMYAEADCYLFPSRGEGWGLPPREAAATGLPVIATAATGLMVGIEEWGLPLRVARWETAEYGHFDAGTVGEWAEPDFEHLVELMRWCESHREDAAGLGARAAGWLRANQTWEHTARRLVEVLAVNGFGERIERMGNGLQC